MSSENILFTGNWFSHPIVLITIYVAISVKNNYCKWINKRFDNDKCY